MPTVDQMTRATAKGLGSIPHWVVEKDDAISYLLAGIGQTDRLSEALILKGGTALRKFSFEDYRFSEDLDFTLRHTVSRAEMGKAMDEARSRVDPFEPVETQVKRILKDLRVLLPLRFEIRTIAVKIPRSTRGRPMGPSRTSESS